MRLPLGRSAVVVAALALTAGCAAGPAGTTAPVSSPATPATVAGTPDTPMAGSSAAISVPAASGATPAAPMGTSAPPTTSDSPATTPTTPTARPSSSSRTPGPSTPTATASVEPSRLFADCPTPPAKWLKAAPGSGKTVALTFDDGPAPADSDLLAALDREGVHATFFFTGQHAQADPETVRKVAASGHLVAAHSWEHRYPSEVKGEWTRAYLTREFVRTAALLGSLTGEPTCYYRPPGGNSQNVLETAGPLGITVVHWSVDTQDYLQGSRRNAEDTATIVAKGTSIMSGDADHPIVLMHSGKASHEPDSRYSPNRSNTVAALPTIIAWYRDHGYRFVRMDGRA